MELLAIRTLQDPPPEVEAYQRCEALIRRRGPLMMIAGGGPIQRELRPWRRMTLADIEGIRELRADSLSERAISKITGWSKSRVHEICHAP